jgi:RND family efflux transporter MFP subunit
MSHHLDKIAMTPTDLSTLGIDRTPSKRRHRRRWTWAIAGISVIAAAAAASAKYTGPVFVETAPVMTAYPSQAITTLNATGYVVAQRKASVASKATGRLEWLGVVEGSRVKRGEVIARLESRDVAATREQAAANLKVAQANVDQGLVELADAERNFKRSRELVAQNFISQAAHDTALARYNKAKASIQSLEASVAVARANLKVADVALDQTVIRTPFDGVVLTKHANVGDNITPFSNAVDTKGAVVTIADMSTLEVDVDVSESSLGQAQVGQHVEIQLDALPDRRFLGVVNRIVPTVDRAKATVLVKVKFLEHDERVLPDMSAKVAFLGREPSAAEREPVTVAPAAAIVERNGAKFVYLLNDGRARETPVETGRAVGELVEVHGVTVGERVVLKPLGQVADGVALRVAQK